MIVGDAYYARKEISPTRVFFQIFACELSFKWISL
jgi:hypothetical protein